MDTEIGATLKTSRRLLWLTTISAVLIVGADMVSVACRSALGLDVTFRLTLALFAVFSCVFLSAVCPPSGGMSFGFRITPRQGWRFWIRAASVLGAVLFVILFCTGLGLVALGYRLPEPFIRSSSDIWPLFILMCFTSPLFEEVVYRLILCPPCAALIGVRSCIALNGLMFAALHFLNGNPSPENLLSGFILSWAFLKSETILIPIFIHAAGNACALLWNVAYFYWLNGEGP